MVVIEELYIGPTMASHSGHNVQYHGKVEKQERKARRIYVGYDRW